MSSLRLVLVPFHNNQHQPYACGAQHCAASDGQWYWPISIRLWAHIDLCANKLKIRYALRSWFFFHSHRLSPAVTALSCSINRTIDGWLDVRIVDANKTRKWTTNNCCCLVSMVRHENHFVHSATVRFVFRIVCAPREMNMCLTIVASPCVPGKMWSNEWRNYDDDDTVRYIPNRRPQYSFFPFNSLQLQHDWMLLKPIGFECVPLMLHLTSLPTMDSAVGKYIHIRSNDAGIAFYNFTSVRWMQKSATAPPPAISIPIIDKLKSK